MRHLLPQTNFPEALDDSPNPGSQVRPNTSANQLFDYLQLVNLSKRPSTNVELGHEFVEIQQIGSAFAHQ